MNGKPVLLLESEPALRDQLTGLLRGWGYAPLVAGSADEALAALATTQFHVAIMGLDPKATEGIDLLRQLKLEGRDPGPVILLVDPSDVKGIAEAAALGASDFVRKPFKSEELETALKEVSADFRRPWGCGPADDSTRRIEEEVALWRSPRMQELWKVVQQAARIDITVLICGETGTGKDLVARAIHHLSTRHRRPFVKVNCAAVPRELLESELFGHERGAFTGAHQQKIGKFESANHGTIFLDEIGDLHPALQAKLLHVLQDGEFCRVGGRSSVKVDVRIMAATNQDLERAVAAGHFREDLYYRLNVIQLVVPPLRERREEIPLLIDYFARRYSKLFNRIGFTVPPQVVERLVQHSYPGNVRELENIIKRMIVLNDPFLARSWLPQHAEPPEGNGGSRVEGPATSLKAIARKAALAAEREAIATALAQTRWNRVKAAKLLNISYRALLYKIKDVGLEPDGSVRNTQPTASQKV